MTGFVYFLRCGDFVKIGFSKNPKGRARALAASLPFQIELAAAYPGTFFHEQKLHRLFAPHRARGEWFRLHADIAAVIERGLPAYEEPPMPTVKTDALQRAVTAIGGATKLAALLGITPQALSQWARPPVMRVLQIEHLTGVSCHDLRPDIYRPEDAFRERAA